MGSGGGNNRSSNIDPSDLEQFYKNSKSETEQAEFYHTVSSMLDDYLIQFNDRPYDNIQEKLNDIKDAIHDEIEGLVDLKYGGSIQKHTYVNGLSDIDALVIINQTELSDKDPESIKDYFFMKLKDSIKDETIKISKGVLAITIKYKDGIEIQLLPALRTEQGVKIPSHNGNEWSKVVTPQSFAKKLTKTNEKLNQKVVPTIKLIKAINSQFPEQRQMSGYHIESLAIEAFKGYKGEKTIKELIKHFFKVSKELVKEPIKDKTNQSLHVDDYLGKKNSESRKSLSFQLDFIYRKINNADNACSKKMWEDIFGDI